MLARWGNSQQSFLASSGHLLGISAGPASRSGDSRLAAGGEGRSALGDC